MEGSVCEIFSFHGKTSARAGSLKLDGSWLGSSRIILNELRELEMRQVLVPKWRFSSHSKREELKIFAAVAWLSKTKQILATGQACNFLPNMPVSINLTERINWFLIPKFRELAASTRLMAFSAWKKFFIFCWIFSYAFMFCEVSLFMCIIPLNGAKNLERRKWFQQRQNLRILDANGSSRSALCPINASRLGSQNFEPTRAVCISARSATSKEWLTQVYSISAWFWSSRGGQCGRAQQFFSTLVDKMRVH